MCTADSRRYSPCSGPTTAATRDFEITGSLGQVTPWSRAPGLSRFPGSGVSGWRLQAGGCRRKVAGRSPVYGHVGEGARAGHLNQQPDRGHSVDACLGPGRSQAIAMAMVLTWLNWRLGITVRPILPTEHRKLEGGMRFIFVHGTGVRRERFDDLFRWVREGLTEHFQDADVVPYYWGDAFGSTLSAGGASVPGMATTRGAVDPEEADAAEWLLLLTDPFCELRVLAALGTADDGLRMPGVQSAGERVADSLRKLPRDLTLSSYGADELARLLSDAGLIDGYSDALDELTDSDEFRDACTAAQDDVAAAELATAASRAIVALLLAGAGDMVVCTGDERDRMVALLSSRIGGTARGPGLRAAGVLLKLGLRWTPQSVLDRKRGKFTSDSASEVGDILRYQARGGPLRDHLAQLISQSPEPPVMIGHSLGGIALVDTLALAAVRQQPLPVRLLVTVGSQAPFLHELGALAGLPPSATLPPGFPRWLNIYDRRDLLSYLAEPVFPGDPRVSDHEVHSRQPFPISHSAYWKLGAVYDRIGEALQ
jgi:hypothetical protein